ncbi:hypothetical protein CTAYLR_008691 [Chrysophaeum taylorii]|uniref:NAD(P)-binding domain-containing protein n=1 Tax=Chrysophaeum taylorii TaxID=2483200 RepID=A0AAD7UNM7_9STRA|nr:hypothetical protein CTAYLR_008691 [Chrysophaeum taylorii]
MFLLLVLVVSRCEGLSSSGHAVIVQNKGGGHGEIGFHLAKALAAAKDLEVTILQDAAAKASALPFCKYDEVPAKVTWCDLGDTAAIEAALRGTPTVTHVFDNFAKSRDEAAPFANAAKKSPMLRCYAFVSSAGMYTSKGILRETDPVKETGQRDVEVYLNEELPGKWCSFRPQYIYGPYTNKRDYLDWFLHRVSRELPLAVPGDAQQPVSVTHCEDVATLLASVVGNELEAANQVFNCGTDKLCSYDDLCRAAARGLGKPPPVVASLPPGTKSTFPFRPNAEGFAVRVKKAKDKLKWAGATHDVLADLEGFYKDDFLALGHHLGPLDTQNDMLHLAANL